MTYALLVWTKCHEQKKITCDKISSSASSRHHTFQKRVYMPLICTLGPVHTRQLCKDELRILFQHSHQDNQLYEIFITTILYLLQGQQHVIRALICSLNDLKVLPCLPGRDALDAKSSFDRLHKIVLLYARTKNFFIGWLV